MPVFLYGLEHIGYVAVVVGGHEMFIWPFFLALLLMLYTLVTIVIFTVFFSLNPTIG